MGTCFSSSSSSSRRDVDMVERYYATRQRDMELFAQYKLSMQRYKDARDKYDRERYYATRQRDTDLFDDQYKLSMQRHKDTRDKYDSSRRFDVFSNSSDEDDYYSPRRSFDDGSITSDESYAKELQESLFSSSPASPVENNHQPETNTENQRAITENELAIWIKQQEQEMVQTEIEPAKTENESTTWINELLKFTTDTEHAAWTKHPELEIRTENDSSTWINPFVDINIETRTKQELETEIKPAEPSGGFCMICIEEKHSSEIFKGTVTCTHSYCTECTIRYLTTKIEENVAGIKCPDMECTQLIDLYTCRDLLTNDMFERWDKKLRDSLILSWEQLECPFKDCSAMMVVDDEDEGENARETECPSCHRLFCAQCKVKWHSGIGCEEFQRSRNKGKEIIKSSDHEDNLLIKMADRKKWRRCPSCKFYVEKVDGCMKIYCRCGLIFCYGCGLVGADYSHKCPKPKDRRKGFWGL